VTRLLAALVVLLAALPAVLPAWAQSGPRAPGPAPGPPRIVGSANNGCIAGAVRLPDAAPGMMTVRHSRSQFWGHPDTIAGLKLLAQRAQAAGLPDLYMNDLGPPRGGPAPGHASHQNGLDADVYLDISGPRPILTATQRDTIEPPGLVRPDQRGVDLSRWKPGHVTLLRIAAELPNVDRILVNAAIKKQLCLEVPANDRAWLRRIRPWYAHAAHMHIHFRCPAGQKECIDIAPIPAGDGCDASLQWWFDRLDEPPAPRKPGKPPPRPKPPAACAAIMAAPSVASAAPR
jgi:penicillin-insensitive murein endopeptidase